MSERTREAVESTFIEVVEKLTFMFGEQVAMADVAVGTEPWAEACMAFSGDVAGSLAVVVPRSLQPEIAANILGLDPDMISQREMLDDALREMLNVVCGHVIRAVAGPGCAFDLVTPVNRELAGPDLAAMMADPATTAYLMDDEPVLMHFELER